MQEVWACGIGREDQMRVEELEKWKHWFGDSIKTCTCSVPRCYHLQGFEILEAD